MTRGVSAASSEDYVEGELCMATAHGLAPSPDDVEKNPENSFFFRNC